MVWRQPGIFGGRHWLRLYGDILRGSLQMKAALIALALTGCTTWHKTSDSATEQRWVVAPSEVIRAIPGCETALACAVRFTRPLCVPEELPRNRPVCVVLTEQPKHMLASFVINHESLHCDGRDHL